MNSLPLCLALLTTPLGQEPQTPDEFVVRKDADHQPSDGVVRQMIRKENGERGRRFHREYLGPRRFFPGTSVGSALQWLGRVQAPEGFWPRSVDPRQTVPGARADEASREQDRVLGVTATVLLAFLADGDDPSYGEHRATVQRGYLWLGREFARLGIDREGRAPKPSIDFATAVQAFVEGYAHVPSDWMRSHAVNGLRAVEQGLREPHPDNGVGIEGLHARTLAALVLFLGADVGIPVDLELARAERERAGKRLRATMSSPLSPDQLTIAAILTSIGWLDRESLPELMTPVYFASLEGLEQHSHAMHWKSLAMEQYGRSDHWSQWMQPFFPILIDLQDPDGSWAPSQGESRERATALRAATMLMVIRYNEHLGDERGFVKGGASQPPRPRKK